MSCFKSGLIPHPEQKQQDAHYKMMWREHIPYVIESDLADHQSDIRVISGSIKSTNAIACPPHSWAAANENRVNIYLISLEPHAELTIPASSATATRFAYFYQGNKLWIEAQAIQFKHLVELKPDQAIQLKAGGLEARILWLEGEPIAKPVAMRGSFVLNTPQELNDAFKCYRETHLGDWPWDSAALVFKRTQPRFTSYEGGKREEYPETDDL